MPQDLLSPDEFGQMLADPAFSALPFDTRKSYVEKGIGEASRFISERGGGWTPETWQKFGTAAQTARQFVNDSETLTETGKRYAGVAWQTIKDLPAIFGVGAMGLSPVLPDGKPGAGVVGQIPGETLGPALGRNIVSLAASGAAMLSNAEKPLVQKLDTLKQQIDAGDFLTHKGGFQGWIDQQHQAVKDEQAKFYDNKDWADQNSLLGNPENAQLMQNYLATRSPESWAALQSNVLRTPFMAKLQGDKTALETQSKLGQALKPETQNLISEAADPAEIVPGFFAAKKGMEAMSTGVTLGKRAKGAAKGVLGEMAGEQVSASIDNPYVTAEQRLQIAKDSMAGALGLMGAGAGGQAVANRFSPQDPNAPLPSTQTATPSPTAPNASAAAQVGAGANQVPDTVNDPLEASFQRALGIDPAAARSARAPILQGVPDANLQPNQAGVGQTMSDTSQTPLTPGERAPADMTEPDAIAGVTAAPAQTITGSNAQTGAEMPVPSPTADAGAGAGAMVQAPQVGDVVNYEGYAGRLQQDGPRLVVEVPNGPVVEVADLAGVQHAAGDTVQQVRMAELRTMPDPQVSETKFMPAGNGTLSLRDNTGNTYVPHNDQLLRSVRTNEQGGVEVLLRNPKRPGQVIKLTGKQAEQAQEAILEAAINVEQQGGTVRYGTSRGMQNLKGGNRGNAGSTTLPGAAADALVNLASAAVRAGQTFAQWAKSMVQRFGEAVRKHLAGIWQQVTSPQTNAAQNVRMGMAQGTAPVTLSNSGAVLNPAQVSPTLQPAVKQTNVLKQMFSAVPKFTAFRGALNGWIGRSQTSTLAVNHLMTELEKRVPDVTQRIGITNWIQAAGDDTVLAAREAKSMGKTRAGYTAARNLSPVALTEAQRVASFYERALAHAKANGLEVNALENYVNQVWQKPGVSGHRAFAQFTGNLTRSFKFGQQRKIESFFEGEQKGLTPATKDISKLMGLYLTEMNKTLSTRQLIAELTQTAAQDGRPLAMPMGAALPTQDGQPGEITLILPGAKGSVTFQGNKHDTGDFVRLNHPALAKWKMAANDTEGNPVMVLGELALHPEAAGIMTAALGRSKLREFYDSASDNIAGTLLRKAIKTVDVLQSQIKASMMSLSPFHIVQEGTHAVGHKVNPFSNIPTVDPADPAHVDAMNHGLMLASESHGMEAFMDGLTGRGSWMEKIPGIGQLIQRIGDFTFSHYIPGLKLKTYDHILARNTVRFDAEMKAGTVTLDDVKYLSAKQTNGAYGHLNYKDMGRDPTIQHLLRAVLLAPDFLEARARFTGQAIQGITGKVGREQAVAMATLAVTFWVAARVINAAMNDGDWKPEEPFGVVIGNRTYTMRSVPEDIYRLFHRPQQFVAGRVAPVIGTGFMEGLYGLNYRGEKVGGAEALQDVLTNAIPMSIRMVPGIDKLVAGQKNRPVNAWEQFLGSLGLQIGRHSPITELQREAHKFAVASGADERGSYPVSKFQQLRYALEDLDWEKASGEIKGLLKLKNNRGELSDNFKSSLFRHWTVNSAMDVQWKASLKPDQRALMQHAEARRLEVWQRFRKLLAQ